MSNITCLGCGRDVKEGMTPGYCYDCIDDSGDGPGADIMLRRKRADITSAVAEIFSDRDMELHPNADLAIADIVELIMERSDVQQ